LDAQSKPTVHPKNSRKWILLVAVIKNMDSEKFYFQIDYKGVKRTSSSEFGEGCSQETIFVEVAADAFANSVDDAAIDSAVEEIALTTARQVARQNLAELENSSQSVSRLEELPPIFQEGRADRPGIGSASLAESGVDQVVLCFPEILREIN
jgi:hypothetical protein